MEIITVEMSWFYHSPAQKSNFIQNEYVTVFKWVHLHPRHAKCVLFKRSPSLETLQSTQVFKNHHSLNVYGSCKDFFFKKKKKNPTKNNKEQ